MYLWLFTQKVFLSGFYLIKAKVYEKCERVKFFYTIKILPKDLMMGLN